MSNNENFEKLYNEYHQHVRLMIFRVHGEQEIDDLVQKVFVKIFLNLENFKGESNIKTWIYRITMNSLKDHWRSNSRKSWLNFFSPTSVPEVTYNFNEDSNMELARALKMVNELLTPKLREVIALYSFEELTLNEISEVLQIPLGTVKSRLHKAHKILKEAKIIEEEYE